MEAWFLQELTAADLPQHCMVPNMFCNGHDRNRQNRPSFWSKVEVVATEEAIGFKGQIEMWHFKPSRL